MKQPEIDYLSMPDYEEIPPIGYAKPPKQSESKTPFTLAQFSIRGDSGEMRKQMLGTQYVIDRIAIRGQSTVVYAKYNTGKTLLILWGISQSVEKGVIDGNDVYYINADDDFDGLTTKTEIAEQYGFHMLTPGLKGFNPSAMQGYMRQMIEDGTADKSVLILDTLKKFTDAMDKKKSSEFMTRLGEFITAKGTVIMLSHVNKSRDENGKLVHCGTSDIPDDASCVFMLDEISTAKNRKQVLFENIKNRGVVARELAFSYSVEEGQTYRQIFDSVQVETDASSAQAKAALEESIKLERDKGIINSIIETIKAGIVNKTELIKAVQEDTGKSKPGITSVLNDYCGTKWQVSIGDKNAKTYTVITNSQSTENEYRHYRDGE